MTRWAWSWALLVGLALPCCGHRSLPVDTPDGNLVVDAGSPETGVDASRAPDCGPLSGLTASRRVAGFRSRGALFHPALKRLLLVDIPASGHGALHVVELPAGTPTFLATGISAVQWLDRDGTRALTMRPSSTSSYLPYDLQVVTPAPPWGETPVSTNLCGHAVKAGGDRVFVVRDCIGGQIGTLDVVHLPAGAAPTTTSAVAQQVEVASLAVSADGKQVAFVAGVTGSGCYHTHGVARIVDTQDAVRLVGAQVASRSLQFLQDGRLLFGQVQACNKPAYQLMLDRGGAKPPLKPGQPHDYGSYGYFNETRYEVSPDGAQVLGSSLAGSLDGPSLLYAIRLDGSGESLLAQDLYPFWSISAVFRAWAFAADGAVVHASLISAGPPPRMGLSASGTGGKAVTLSQDLFGIFYALSPTRGEAALVQHDAAGNQSLISAATATGTLSLLSTAAAGETLRDVAYVADGRGVLFVAQTKGASSTSTLSYVQRTGAGATPLGSWNNSPYLPYTQDPDGCAVLFNSDDATTGGTYLAPIPR